MRFKEEEMLKPLIFVSLLIVALVTGCAPMLTPVPTSTATPLPPTATPLPSPTATPSPGSSPTPGLREPASPNLTVMSARLPCVVSTAAWLNGAAYLFCDINSTDDTFDDAVLRYDPTSDSLTMMKARIPTARTGMSSAAAGRYIYLFGGGPRYFRLTPDILRYDPVADVLQVMSAQLPTGLYWTSAVWDGQAIYVVAGYPWNDRILRYDPASEVVTVVKSRLARAKDSTGSVWDGRYIYILGGDYGGEEIYRFDPAADAIELLDAQLPIMRRNGAYWDGRYAYIFGGGLQEGPYVSKYSDEIVRFDPQTEEVAILKDRLPQPMWRNPAVWDGSAFYLFGGETQDGLIDPRILRWVPAASN